MSSVNKRPWSAQEDLQSQELLGYERSCPVLPEDGDLTEIRL